MAAFITLVVVENLWVGPQSARRPSKDIPSAPSRFAASSVAWPPLIRFYEYWLIAMYGYMMCNLLMSKLGRFVQVNQVAYPIHV